MGGEGGSRGEIEKEKYVVCAGNLGRMKRIRVTPNITFHSPVFSAIIPTSVKISV